MIVAFCGHRDYVGGAEDAKRILAQLEKEVGDTDCEFFLGERGGFDRFAYGCAKSYQKMHPNARLIFVTPYMSGNRQKKEEAWDRGRFDLILYPALEGVPPRYAIARRNRWIVQCADLVIAYVAREDGGAYKMLQYARRLHKSVYNIATLR